MCSAAGAAQQAQVRAWRVVRVRRRRDGAEVRAQSAPRAIFMLFDGAVISTF